MRPLAPIATSAHVEQGKVGAVSECLGSTFI